MTERAGANATVIRATYEPSDYRAQPPSGYDAPPPVALTGVVEPPTKPTSSDLKQDIYEYLLDQGYEEVDLIGLTKAELLELVSD